MLTPDELADRLASHDAHLDLDCPLDVADAMRRIAIERDRLRLELAAAMRRASAAELALMSMTKRLALAVPAFDGVPDEDDGWAGDCRQQAGAL